MHLCAGRHLHRCMHACMQGRGGPHCWGNSLCGPHKPKENEVSLYPFPSLPPQPPPHLLNHPHAPSNQQKERERKTDKKSGPFLPFPSFFFKKKKSEDSTAPVRQSRNNVYFSVNVLLLPNQYRQCAFSDRVVLTPEQVLKNSEKKKKKKRTL